MYKTILILAAAFFPVGIASADKPPLVILDPNLQVATYVGAGISQPIRIVFIGPNDAFVLEKASRQVKRVIGGVVQPTPVLDLAVNSNSERGLLSLVLHPNFPATPFVYIRWTQSSTGADSGVVSEVPLLGNRVDRFIWNGSTLTMDQNLILLRSRQTDNVEVPGHPGTTNAAEQANHNGGVLKFGPDGKLYLFMGDQGRRGWLQNLPSGPFLTPPQTDDTFGGPAPDNAHFTGGRGSRAFVLAAGIRGFIGDWVGPANVGALTELLAGYGFGERRRGRRISRHAGGWTR